MYLILNWQYWVHLYNETGCQHQYRYICCCSHTNTDSNTDKFIEDKKGKQKRSQRSATFFDTLILKIYNRKTTKRIVNISNKNETKLIGMTALQVRMRTPYLTIRMLQVHCKQNTFQNSLQLCYRDHWMLDSYLPSIHIIQIIDISSTKEETPLLINWIFTTSLNRNPQKFHIQLLYP